MQTERSDDWLQTYTGRRFYFFEPRIDDIVIEDIAHALSLQCRYNGHCLIFYSVAEHSVRVATALDSMTPHWGLARWGLMHDAAEAYLGDMVRPLKRSMPEYRKAEDRMMHVICERFGLESPMPSEISDMDLVLLSTEKRDLMAPPPRPWSSIEDAPPLPDKILPLSPQDAERAFLAQFERLFGT